MATPVTAQQQPETVSSGQRVAVLIPCFNEASTIRRVITDFAAAIPGAAIYVYDNNSTDGTAEVACGAGALVRRVWRQGKGNVVRRMFSDINADVYVLVDGDATYDAGSAPAMIARLLSDHLDMVVGTRVQQDQKTYRLGHATGNWLLTTFVSLMFEAPFTDILSGYRVLSRRLVKSFPVLSEGFEVETEISVHPLGLDLEIAEIPTPYYARPQGSVSKLKTWSDGWRILTMIFRLYRAERPLAFFSGIGIGFAILSILLAVPLAVTYLEEGLVPRIPTAILSTGLMLLCFLAISVGLILDTVTRGRREMKLIAYIRQREPDEEGAIQRFRAS
jgi:glycosyltransferase involved in cell wall biosynthesis